MKKYLILTFTLIIPYFIFSQAVDVYSGLTNPRGLEFVGDYLYISESEAHIVSKIDISEASPTKEIVANPVYICYGLELNGNNLIIAESGFGRVVQINLSSTLPISPTTIASGFTDPDAVILNGNDLYISNWSIGKISKVDITANPATPVDFITGLNDPRALAIKDNYLYVGQYQKISKIDITSSTPVAIDIVTGLNNGIAELIFNGDELYFSTFNSSGEISKINITDNTPIPINVFNTGTSTYGFTIKNDELYFAEYFNGNIKKVDLTTLSIEEQQLRIVKIYPNPSSEFIQISNLKSEESYNIFNVLGAKVKNGMISNNEQIDIKNLPKGLYFLKFVNGNSFKFIKE